ncbi:MAG: glycosyltransferase [Planctomycetes bacterium]|nr:glycosyltransferase [Planctomycetota bacterium]
MRILLLSPFVPDRGAPHGGGIYLATLAAALARRVELGLVALARPGDDTRAAAGPWTYRHLVPHLDLPDRRRRVRHRLRMLWHWRRLPLVAAKHWQPALPAALASARAEFAPDAVLLEMAQMAQYLPFVRDLPTILTDHEAGCPANTHTGLGPLGDRRDCRLWRRYVQHFYPMASLLQTVTTEDAAALRTLVHRPVEVREPTFDVPATPVAPDAAPPRALFLGDYSHRPNPEAAAMLAREVLPLLRAAEPRTELWLAGPHAERVQPLATAPGVRVVGFVPDLHALFGEARLLLAPLLSGGGFRMKSLAALAHGLPVVTNGLGARGCSAPPPARTVAEGAQALADAALPLLRSPAAAADAGRAAFAWAHRNLTGDAVAQTQVERLQRLRPAATT